MRVASKLLSKFSSIRDKSKQNVNIKVIFSLKRRNCANSVAKSFRLRCPRGVGACRNRQSSYRTTRSTSAINKNGSFNALAKSRTNSGDELTSALSILSRKQGKLIRLRRKGKKCYHSCFSSQVPFDRAEIFVRRFEQ